MIGFFIFYIFFLILTMALYPVLLHYKIEKYRAEKMAFYIPLTVIGAPLFFSIWLIDEYMRYIDSKFGIKEI